MATTVPHADDLPAMNTIKKEGIIAYRDHRSEGYRS